MVGLAVFDAGRRRVVFVVAAISSLWGATVARAEAPVHDEPPPWPGAIESPDGLARGTYVRVPQYDQASALQAEPFTAEGGSAPHIIYLNRCAGGLLVTSGWPDDSISNQSSILGGAVNFPEFPFGDSQWNQMVEITRELYAPFNVVVTDQDPGNTPHDEVVVCGSGSLAGFGGAGGVAPFSCGVIDNAISYVFPESMGNDPQRLAEVVGQESAHAWGLEHELECSDPMTYLSPCGPKTFQDQEVQCGEYSPRACDCGGSTQNSYQMIMDIFGPSEPDTQAPVARILYPIDGDTFSPGDSFSIEVDVSDDVQLTGVSMFLDGQLMSADSEPPYGPWPVTNVPEGTYTVHITASDGAGNEAESTPVTFYVTADGVPPPAGNDDAGPADDDGGDGDIDPDDDDLDDGNDELGDDEPGALPADYGLYGDATGCACTAGRDRGDGPGGWALGLFVLLWGWRRRRTAAA